MEHSVYNDSIGILLTKYFYNMLIFMGVPIDNWVGNVCLVFLFDLYDTV